MGTAGNPWKWGQNWRQYRWDGDQVYGNYRGGGDDLLFTD